MSTEGPPDTSPESFDQWFARELAELNAVLARLEASLEVPPAEPVAPPRKRGRNKNAGETSPEVPPARSLEHGEGNGGGPEAVATVIEAAAAPVGLAAAVAQSAPPPPPAPESATSALPSGTDLSDPRNFGLLPPTPELERGTSSADDYRQRLARHITFATKVLHTSQVTAAVWREWRAFEKTAQQRLRELSTPTVPVE
jgi:hypothetical protein